MSGSHYLCPKRDVEMIHNRRTYNSKTVAGGTTATAATEAGKVCGMNHQP